MKARRQSLTAEAVAGIGAALAVILVVAGIEIAQGKGPSVVAWLVIGPFLSAAFAPWRYVVGVGALATALATGVVIGDTDGVTVVDTSTVVGLVLATGVAVAVSIVRQGQNQRFTELVRLATVAQEAVLSRSGPQGGERGGAGRGG